MRLRGGKKYVKESIQLTSSPVFKNTINKISKYPIEENYRPPRKCAVTSLIKTCKALIDEEKPENKFHDRSWNKVDAILDQVSHMLDVHNLELSDQESTLRNQINRLSQCIKLLNDLRKKTCISLRRIDKRRQKIKNSLRKITQFHNYILNNPDNEFFHIIAEIKFFKNALDKLYSLNKTETEIAAKYCKITRSTFNLVDRAVQTIRRQADRSKYNVSPIEGSNEYNRRIELIDSWTKEKNGDLESCAICLSEPEKDVQFSEFISCKHKFHKDCLKKWLLIKMRCPTCRFFIDKKYESLNTV